MALKIYIYTDKLLIKCYMTHFLVQLLKNHGSNRANRYFLLTNSSGYFNIFSSAYFLKSYQPRVCLLHSPLFFGWFWIWRHQRTKRDRIFPDMMAFCYTLLKASREWISYMIVASANTLNCRLIMTCSLETSTSFFSEDSHATVLQMRGSLCFRSNIPWSKFESSPQKGPEHFFY